MRLSGTDEVEDTFSGGKNETVGGVRSIVKQIVAETLMKNHL